MISTSEEYKKEQKQALREKSYVYVNVGIINLEAKKRAQASGVTAYSCSNSTFRLKTKDTINIPQYATLENSFTKVNKTNAILPRDSSLYNKQQGLVSNVLCGGIRITFGDFTDVSIKGLTIDFGEFYPSYFSISNDINSYEYEKNDSSLFVCEDQFDSSSYIDIVPFEMSETGQRMRIRSLEFGVGLSFENEQIISTHRRNAISHISETLPLKTFDFTLLNLSRRFSQDNPWSFASYISEGQMVEYHYGRQLIDELGNSSIYIIPGGKTYIKTWSSDNISAKFSTVGKLDMLDSEYYKGTFDDSGLRTAYQVAESVFEDMGLESDEYYIDSYLKKLYMRNPLPIGTHKACLQMIANATRSILREDEEGRVCINSSFKPGYTDVTVTATNYDDYLSDITNIMDAEEYNNFATLEEGFTRVDNRMYISPREELEDESEIVGVGFLSEVTSSSTLQIDFGAQWTFYSFLMIFSETFPESILVEYYGDNVKKGELTLTEFEFETKVEHEFADVNIIKFTFYVEDVVGLLIDENDDFIATETDDIICFNSGAERRVHLNSLIFNPYSDYELTNMDMMDSPVATSVEHVKDIEINYYSYGYGTEVKQLSSVEVDYGTNIIKLPNAASDYRLLWDDDNVREWSNTSTYAQNVSVRYNGYKYTAKQSVPAGVVPTNTTYWQYVPVEGAQIISSGAYYVEVEVTILTSYKLAIYGCPMLVNYQTFVKQLHDTGNVKKLNNVLIQTSFDPNYGGDNRKVNAFDIAYWLEEYFTNDTEYSITYRGEPAIECDDMIYVENQFVKDNLCRVEQEEISTSIGMSLTNNIKLRRISYDKGRDAVVGIAQTDIDKTALERS